MGFIVDEIDDDEVGLGALECVGGPGPNFAHHGPAFGPWHRQLLKLYEAELLRLRREVGELRRANEILKTASAFFAAAELDRRLK